MKTIIKTFIHISNTKPLIFAAALATVALSLAAAIFYEGRAYRAYLDEKEYYAELAAMTEEELAIYDPSGTERNLWAEHPEEVERMAVAEYVRQMAGSAILLIIAFYGIAVTVSMRQTVAWPRYAAYIMCGAAPGRVRRMAAWDAVLLAASGFAFGTGLSAIYFWLMPPGFVEMPTAGQFAVTFGVVTAASAALAILRTGRNIRWGILTAR